MRLASARDRGRAHPLDGGLVRRRLLERDVQGREVERCEPVGPRWRRRSPILPGCDDKFERPGSTGGPGRAPFDAAMAEVVGATKPPVVSFHFGLPDAALLARVKAAGARIYSLAGYDGSFHAPCLPGSPDPNSGAGAVPAKARNFYVPHDSRGNRT